MVQPQSSTITPPLHSLSRMACLVGTHVTITVFSHNRDHQSVTTLCCTFNCERVCMWGLSCWVLGNALILAIVTLRYFLKVQPPAMVFGLVLQLLVAILPSPGNRWRGPEGVQRGSDKREEEKDWTIRMRKKARRESKERRGEEKHKKIMKGE